MICFLWGKDKIWTTYCVSLACISKTCCALFGCWEHLLSLLAKASTSHMTNEYPLHPGKVKLGGNILFVTLVQNRWLLNKCCTFVFILIFWWIIVGSENVNLQLDGNHSNSIYTDKQVHVENWPIRDCLITTGIHEIYWSLSRFKLLILNFICQTRRKAQDWAEQAGKLKLYKLQSMKKQKDPRLTLYVYGMPFVSRILFCHL